VLQDSQAAGSQRWLHNQEEKEIKNILSFKKAHHSAWWAFFIKNDKAQSFDHVVAFAI
jgi:hypothetical protein